MYTIFHREGAIPPQVIEEIATESFPIEGSRTWLGNLYVEEDYLDDDTFYEALEAFLQVAATDLDYEWLPGTKYTQEGMGLDVLQHDYRSLSIILLTVL